MAGPTGKFPGGKLNPDDRGEIKIEIRGTTDGKVVVDFGVPVQWIAMNPAQLIEFADVLRAKAKEMGKHVDELDDHQLALWEEYITSWIDRHYMVYESEQVICTLKRQAELWESIKSIPVK